MFDEQKLISLKQNFTSQQFQWIKTDRPELIGKLVKCRDVQPTPDGRFTVLFDDGSRIDSSKLTSNLMLITSESQPLSKSEIESLYPNRPRVAPPQNRAASDPSPLPPAQPQVQAPPPLVNSQPVPAPAPEKKANMFVMFNSEPTNISIDLEVKLPEKKLLKMMFLGAEDKEKFVSELADYLLEMINKSVITESINQMLTPPPKKKIEPGVRLTEAK